MSFQSTMIEQTRMPLPVAAFQVCMVAIPNWPAPRHSNWAQMYRLAYENALAVTAIQRFERFFESSLN